MPLDQPLFSYGLHTLLMSHEADIRTATNLRTTRDEVLRSVAEKHLLRIREQYIGSNHV